jgi:SAM-dependent methyltransferase
MNATAPATNVSSGGLAERTVPGLHQHLIAHLPPLARDAAILDVGCGTGAWLKRLSDAGFTNLWGIDRDLSAFGVPGAHTAVADLDSDRLPFAEQKFDLITAVEVIEHLENPGRLYRLFGTYLSKTGLALVTTPNIHSLVSRLRHLLTGKLGQFDDRGDQTHVSPLLLDGLERILPRYGLALVTRWGYPERGSVAYRPAIRIISRLMRVWLPDSVPGDALCLLIGRRAASAAV